jgi:hypothetical protein
MKRYDAELSALLQNNTTITAAWIDRTGKEPVLHIQTATYHANENLALPDELKDFPIQKHIAPPFTIQITRTFHRQPMNANQACQNEPIRLGTQIQPARSNWLGTAGAPVAFRANDGRKRYGFITNYHVVALDDQPENRPIHQPTTKQPKIATTTLYTRPAPGRENRLDVALCDALIDGYHTIAEEILHIGKPNPQPYTLQPGDPVTKSGRSTALTTAAVRATGVTARVQYGTDTILFVDQDLIENTIEQFSAPGDSGSLILHASTKRPAALLFAGSAYQTLANPIRHILSAYAISFDLRA